MKISIILELLTASFETDTKRASKAWSKFSADAQKDLDKFGKAVGIAFAATGAAVTKMVSDAISAADDIRDLSQRFGIATETLSSFNLIAQQSGTSLETLARGLQGLSKEATGDASALRAMGIDAKDAQGNVKDLDALIAEVADKFATYEDGAEKARLAQQLFGKSGVEMIPMLNQGSKALAEAREQAEKLGLIVGEDFADNADMFNDQMVVIKGLAQGFANDLARELLPNLTSFNQLLIDNATQSQGAGTAASGFADVMRGVGSVLVAVQGGAEKAGVAVAFLIDIIGDQIKFLKDAGSAYGTYLKEFATQGPLDATANWWNSTKDAADKAVVDTGRSFDNLLAQFDDIDSRVADKWLALWREVEKVGDAADETSKGAKKLRPPIDDGGKAAEEAAKKLKDLEEQLDRDAVAFNDLRQSSAQAIATIRAQLDPIEAIEQAFDEQADAINQAIELRIKEGDSYEDLLVLMAALTAQRKKDTAAAIEQQRPVEGVIKSLNEELELMKLSDVERQREVMLRGLGAKATDEQKAAIDKLIGALQDEEKAQAIVNDLTQGFRDFTVDVLTDVDNIEDAFKNLGDSIKNTLIQSLADAAAEMAKTNLIKPIMDQFKGGLDLSQGPVQGYGGGAGGSGLGSLFGSAGSGLGSMFASNPVGWVLAGMMMNNSLFDSGWKPRGGTLSLPDGQEFSGGGSALARSLDNFNNLMTGGLGNLFGDRWASMITGSAILVRAFGHKSPELEGVTSRGTIGANGVGGNDIYHVLEEGGWFRSDRRTNVTGALDTQFRKLMETIIESVTEYGERAARLLGDDLGTIVAGAFTIERDKEGEIVKQFSTVLGKVYEESVEEFATRMQAEQTIAQIDKAFEQVMAKIAPIDVGDGSGGGGPGPGTPPGTGIITGEASAIAERWREDAAMLMEGAEFLLLAATDMRNSVGLLGEGGTLTEVTELVEELAFAGETLTETYGRLYTATALLDQALDLANVQFDMTRAEFVEFAAEIAEAAGGIESAAKLWQTYFDAFYSQEEALAMLIDRTKENATTLLEGLGLDPETTMAEFRAAFEAALPTLTPEQIAEWLRAGEALVHMTNAEAELGAIRAEQAQAAEDLAALLDSLNPEPATEFLRDIADIGAQMDAFSEQANELAIAAGRAGASQEELAQITAWGARQFEMAVDRLRDRVTDLATQLFGTELDQIEAQIDAITRANQDAQRASDELARAQQQRYEQEMQLLKGIRQYLDSLLLSDLSPLNPLDQFREAQSQFASLLAAAQGGDLDALAQVQGAAQALLQQGQTFLGPSAEFTDLFESVFASLEGLGLTTGPATGPSVTVVPGEELDALFARREALLMEQEERNRQQLAELLLVQLGELIAVTEGGLLAVLADQRIDIGELLAALQIDVTALTVETTQQLADVARTLNVSVAELAGAVSESLGELTETNSLLNDAFEAEIAELPEGIQQELLPLLRGVEDAVTEADATAAVDTLRSVVDELAPEFRDALAPYLDLETTTTEPIRDMSDRLADIGESQLAVLSQINDGIATLNGSTAAPEGVNLPAGGGGITAAGEVTAGEAAIVMAIDTTNRRIDRLTSETRAGSTRQSNAIRDTTMEARRNRGY